ncbi:MAG: LamG domain-containing protein, partial [Planctomycetota bacterium]
MSRKLNLLISVLLVLGVGVAGTVRANITVPPDETVSDAQTHGYFQVNDSGTLEVTSTGTLNVSELSGVNGGTLLINGGTVQVDDRFNLGSGLGGTVTMNGGSFTILGDGEDGIEMMDEGGGLSVLEMLGGTLTSYDLQFTDPHERRGMIYIGGGTMIIQNNYEEGVQNRDPQMWIDNGWLVPAPGYVEVDVNYVPAGGFTLTATGGGPVALDPIPAYKETDVCPEGVVLSWTPYEFCVADHNIYFGDSPSDVDENADCCQPHHDTNSWSLDMELELGTWYYWRVEEVNDACDASPWPGIVWQFKTQDGKAMDPFPGDGWKGLPPDVNLSWTPACTAVSHTLYFGTSFDDVNNGTGGTDKGSQSPGYNTGPLSTYTWYYWRVDEVNDTPIKGNVWSFKTGLGGVLMHYKFDGTQGQDLPEPNITDDSGNNIQFTKHVEAGGGSVKYAGPNPAHNPGGTRAEFTWKAGLTAMLIGHEDDELSWSLEISDPCTDDDVRWHHNKSRIDDDILTNRYREWMHVAAVFDITEEVTQKLYLNGEVVETGINRGFNLVDANAVSIGCERNTDGSFGNFLDGRIDELRILDVALDPSGFLYPRATNPDPNDGEGNVDPNDPNDPNVTLSWTPWVNADEHDLYFGTDYDSVRLATVGDNPNNVYVGRLDTNSYDVNGLDYATTYYWRIDEVNGSDVYPGLVWQFLTEFVIVDPNLLLWFPFDEGAGDWAYDNSGHGLNGNDDDMSEGWDPDGAFGYCLEFDADIGFGLDKRTLEGLSNGITISVWLDGYRPGGLKNWVIQAGGGLHYVEVIVPDGNDDYVYWRAGNDTNDLLVWRGATPQDWVGDWHHFAFVKDEDANTMKIYFDSDVARSKDGAISSLSNVVGKPFSVGGAIGSDDYVGKMDDLRVYKHALSAKEIASLFRGGDIELAWGPSPYDRQKDAPYDSDLIWKPGDYAADTNGHDLYFGTDWDEVNDANILIHPNVDYNRVDVNTYELDVLELGKYYYWRVDEVNDACQPEPWRGNVWRFKVADYIIIDDMEDYTPSFSCSGYPITSSTCQEYGWKDGYTNSTSSTLGLVYPGWSTYPEIGAHRSDQA